ncbi:MAG: Stp1/IreP family PP2C-type Ser/Thr phosphatase [Deltaproteobacteria bacterium]|nr:Stp1/IreP family PP2C-type Ser/Thr phosphatase [Deltaproteobacteria bacterium]
MFKLEIASRTDTGRVRERNEDCILVREDLKLFIVADGMGGHKRGDVASRVCVESISEFMDSPEKFIKGEIPPKKELKEKGIISTKEFNLLMAIQFANSRIFQMSYYNATLRGMGTTLVGALFYNYNLFITHVGDSRLYRLRNGRLSQLTYDHSLVNEYIRQGLLTNSEARDFPHKNVIMKAIGLKNIVEVEYRRKKLKEGDMYLLCSDGLTDMLPDEEIEKILKSEKTPGKAADRFVAAANEKGGYDNISVIVLKIKGASQ